MKNITRESFDIVLLLICLLLSMILLNNILNMNYGCEISFADTQLQLVGNYKLR